MSKTIIDLHLHSTHSDGKLTPPQIVKKLTQAKVNFASLTDHDSTAGSSEFNALAGKAGIKTISGTEISADQHGIGIHILGYGINTGNRRLLGLFKKQSAARRKAFDKYVAMFKKAGFIINKNKYGEFRKIKSVARTHVFRLIWEEPQNRELCFKKYRFKGTGWLQSEFINAFMELPGQLAYAKKKNILAKKAIELIHKAGGIAVWAHPGIEIEFKNDKTLNKVFKSLVSHGIDGVEAFSTARSLTKERSKYLCKLAHKHDLIATIGTDDHDGTRIGTLKIPLKYHLEALEKLHQKLTSK
ncbi:MAG: PHP domain-containing protein [Candidatus Yanofskybacteria bacterium]|nr:PHP domain-containing protein [Candidatus Yanofskybacteria bacterium]